MKLFQNKFIAVFFCLVMIGASIFFLAPRGLKKADEELSSLFYLEDITNEKDSAAYNLKKRAALAEELSGLYVKYLGEDETSEELGVLANRLAEPAMRTAGKENKRLTELSQKAYEQLSVNVEAQESAGADLLRIKANLDGYNDILMRLSFNEKAKAFNELISVFPASMLAEFSGLTPIEVL